MKNKKWIVILCVSIFLIAGFNPVNGAENYKINRYFESHEPPLPGLMVGDEPIFKVEIEKNIINQYKQISPVTVSDNIVDIITQIGESMILGYIENLTSFGPRVTGEPGCVDAAEYIYNEFSSMGLDVRYDNWVYGGYDSNNVEATLPGSDTNSDDIYIICGHYDTVYDSPGADDDGSGVVAVLIAAQLMSQLEFNNTIRFVTFSGEEEGLYGSYMYVQDAYNNGDDIKGVLNADMISFALNDEQASSLKIYEDDLSEWLYDFTFSVNQEYDEYIDLALIHSGWSWGSDHYYFWEFGYNAIFYHEYEFNDYYHSPEDTIEHMNLTYDKKTTRLIIATLSELAELSSTNFPPETPNITGLTSSKPKKELLYNFSSTDPEGSNVYYFIDWADGTNTGWIGPYQSSEEITQSHIWLESGKYIIKAKAKDVLGAESEWGTLEITIPRFRFKNDTQILKLLERFPNIFLVLKYLLQN
ncbi:MAG: hypothetical protein A3K77_03315 [Euryarchaeota archaeon RBG_13_31_8]|nr:MAG: hypothetical protein A3K77_03315 [Euryarchaeota archaeon RBG_13_31_8]